MRDRLRHLGQLQGRVPPAGADVRPRTGGSISAPKLKAVLAELAKSHCRTATNRHLVNWIGSRRPSSGCSPRNCCRARIYEDLRTHRRNLRFGEGRESPRVLPVPEDMLQATLPHMVCERAQPSSTAC